MRGPRGRRILHPRSPRPGRNLKESGSRSIGVRVFNGQRAASTYSSDFSRDSLDRMVKSAWSFRRSLRKIRSAEFLTLRNSARSPAISIFITRTFIRCRAGAYRLRAASGKGCARFRPAPQELRRRIVRRGYGTQGSGELAWVRRRIPPVVLLHLRRSHRTNRRWRDAARLLVLRRAHTQQTRIPEQVGKVAAERTLRRLGARKAKTAQVPIIFDPWSPRRSSNTFSKA